MTDVQETVSVPQGSDALAQGIRKLVVAVVTAHKTGGGLAIEALADVQAAIADIGPALTSAGLIGSEFSASPLGVVEAFVLAGVGAARDLTGK